MENAAGTLATQGISDSPFLFAEGDSWFDLPLKTEVVGQLRRFGYRVKSVADYSHTLKSMAYSAEQHRESKRELERLHNRSIVPTAILLSGGGNDLVSRLHSLLNQEGPNIPMFREEEVADFIEDVGDYYYALVSLITNECEKIFELDEPIPVLVHGYAYAVPDGRPFTKGPIKRGPWLEPVFAAKGHEDLSENTEELTKLVKRLNKMLSNFSRSRNVSHFHYVDVRTCLSSDPSRYQMDWDDELHPTPSGFKKVAKKFRQKIQALGNPPR